MLTVLDLFSGIGGFSLGLERTGGFKTVAFCEIDPFCRRVLAKHWPDVPCHEDITRLKGDDVGPVDVICGGFPCQDISVAGKGAGLAGERSGLFYELARLVGELRPSIVILENVSALLSRGLGDVLGELATLGYDAEWHCIPASAVGAPHRRDRIWIVAYAQSIGSQEHATPGANYCQTSGGRTSKYCRSSQTFSNTISDELRQQSGRRGRKNGASSSFPGEHGAAWTMANANACDERGRSSPLQVGRQWITRKAIQDGHAGRTQWGAEPDVGRVAHGVPARVDRLGALGNAVVPQIPELIGHAILAATFKQRDAASDARAVDRVITESIQPAKKLGALKERVEVVCGKARRSA